MDEEGAVSSEEYIPRMGLVVDSPDGDGRRRPRHRRHQRPPVPAQTRAQETGNGEISGVVTNGTTDEPVGNVTVTLSRFESQSPESIDITVEADSEGRYRFAGVDTSDGLVYATSVNYSGVLYGSGMIQVTDTPTAVADITVYETTVSPSEIRLRDRVILLNGTDQAAGEVSLTDIFNVENTGDRSLVPDMRGRTLRLHVPDNATTVSPRAGFDFGTPSVEGSSVYLTSPIRPGTSTPSLAYIIPYRGTGSDLRLTSLYPTDSMRFLIPADETGAGPSVRSNGAELRDDGIMTIGDRDYHVWSLADLGPGTVVDVEIADLPQSAVGNRTLWTTEPIIIAGLAVGAASVVTGTLVRRRGLHLPRPVVVTPAIETSLETRRADLAEALRVLEDDHTQGRIDDTTYASERRAILQDLRGISRAMRGLGEDD